MEFEIINIEVGFQSLMVLVNLMANESESAVGYFDLLLELKQMSLSFEDMPERIVVPFTMKNVLDILEFLSSKNANVYSDLFKEFRLNIETSLEGKGEEEITNMIRLKLAELDSDKARQLNQDYLNGINILRLEIRDIPS